MKDITHTHIYVPSELDNKDFVHIWLGSYQYVPSNKATTTTTPEPPTPNLIVSSKLVLTTTCSNKPVACYTFEGNVNDYSGNGFNGTNKGATFVPGIKGQALSFDASAGNYVRIPNTALNNLRNGTVEAWIKLNTNSDGTIISKQHDNVGTFGVLSVGYSSSPIGSADAGTPGKLYFHSQNHVTPAESTSILDTGKWYFVAVVLTNSFAKFYINGSVDNNTVSGNYSILNDTDPSVQTAIGAWLGSGGGRYFNGNIDEVRIYNRALSQPEIQADMNNSGLNPKPTPYLLLLHHYHHH